MSSEKQPKTPRDERDEILREVKFWIIFFGVCGLLEVALNMVGVSEETFQRVHFVVIALLMGGCVSELLFAGVREVRRIRKSNAERESGSGGAV